MENFKSFSAAEAAAEAYFKEVWGFNDAVGVEEAEGNHVKFYSKADPAFNELFECEIHGRYLYYCHNNSELKVKDSLNQQ